MASFANRTVLITGAGSGIGRQLALNLAAEGAAIAAVDRVPEALDTLEREMAGKPFARAVADVTDRATLREAVTGLEGSLGPPDLLIASAGIGSETSALDFKAEAIEDLIRVNLLGVANSIEAVLSGMIERQSGHLVAISSLASYRGLPKMAGYCASKAGVNALLDSLRIELKPVGIAVTTICPGWIRTPLTANVEAAQPFLMELDDAAGHILGAIRRRLPFYAFPRRAVRRVRLLRWLPSGLSDWLTDWGIRRLEQK
jgi:NAD(P)-dependent dehydrogenase (short-subunit alcohol dehydrogenase family)